MGFVGVFVWWWCFAGGRCLFSFGWWEGFCLFVLGIFWGMDGNDGISYLASF